MRDVGRAYRAFRPDLIHAHGAQAGVTARLARVARPGAPLVHTPHRYAFDDGRGRNASGLAYEGIERALMPLATRVLCVCEAEARIAERIGARGQGARRPQRHRRRWPRARCRSDSPTSRQGGPLIVAVSELFARKGVEVLIEAMPAILGGHPGARLIVAGEGPDRARGRGRPPSARAPRTASSSPATSTTSAGLLGAADVFVNPALAESFPYAVLEAMSAGCPCVVTDAGRTAEAIARRESGIVVPTGDADALAAGIADAARGSAT